MKLSSKRSSFSPFNGESILKTTRYFRAWKGFEKDAYFICVHMKHKPVKMSKKIHKVGRVHCRGTAQCEVYASQQ